MDDPFGNKLALKFILSLFVGLCAFAFIHTLLTA